MAISRSTDIVFLLGAGASAEAGIPTSQDMIRRIEDLLSNGGRWKKFSGLYNHVKSAIYYSYGLRGEFGEGVGYNIEELVNTLNELERNEEHPLYPFIAAWNSRFVALAEADFSAVVEFRNLILDELKRWMCPEDTSLGEYYRGLADLQRDLNFPIPVFSLNYDLCIERLKEYDVDVETGFGGSGPGHYWNWERFEGEMETSAQIVLYKLHGSINWKRDKVTKQLFSVEQIQTVDPQQMEVIFGRDFKLEAADPFLFYTYEFRRYTLMASLIVVVGYGFGDTHINQILAQRLRGDDECCLFVVCKCMAGEEEENHRGIAEKLELEEVLRDRVVVRAGSASEFLMLANLHEVLMGALRSSKDAPF